MIGRSFYNGEEIIQPRQRWTPEEQLWLLDNHPLFTGVCPECGYRFTQSERQIVHFDCPRCSWVDDSV
jgi:rubrerythrin